MLSRNPSSNNIQTGTHLDLIFNIKPRCVIHCDYQTLVFLPIHISINTIIIRTHVTFCSKYYVYHFADFNFFPILPSHATIIRPVLLERHLSQHLKVPNAVTIIKTPNLFIKRVPSLIIIGAILQGPRPWKPRLEIRSTFYQDSSETIYLGESWIDDLRKPAITEGWGRQATKENGRTQKDNPPTHSNEDTQGKRRETSVIARRHK